MWIPPRLGYCARRMDASRSRMPFALCLALVACASYRVLPPAPLSGGTQPIPVRYEKSRLLFFKSQGDDGATARVFAKDNLVVATVERPDSGLFASNDEGATWTFASGPFDFREVIFAQGHLYARGSNRIWHSEDQGRSWASTALLKSDDRLDAMAMGADGALYTAGRSQLYVSRDFAQTWARVNVTLPPQPAWRVRSIVPDPLHPRILMVSLRTEPQVDLLTRFKALLDFSSDEAVSALKLADKHDKTPGAVAWGQAEDGVYLTVDGGGLWKKTALSLDAWIALDDGALYAVAAEPILIAAALMRRNPDLAGAAERQFKGGRVSSDGLREALPYPGRDALLAGPVATALIYKSSDGGASWTRQEEVPLQTAIALRHAMERGGQDSAHAAPPPQKQPSLRERQQPQRAPDDHPVRPGEPPHDQVPPLAQGRYGGLRPRSSQPTLTSGAPSRALAPDTLLAFVDPSRLLARFNGTAPLTGVANDVAWVPTQQGWDALVKALVTESESEGEISLGPAQAEAAFELLRGQDGTWTASGTPLPKGPPRSIASGKDVVFVVRRDGRAWRIAP